MEKDLKKEKKEKEKKKTLFLEGAWNVKKNLITEAGHVLKMFLFYVKSEPQCAYWLGA